MNELVLLCILLLLCACLLDWRHGILVCVIVGFLQDPLRKIIPGTPVSVTALVVLFVIATLIGARMRHFRMTLRALLDWNAPLRTPIKLFMLFVVLSSIMTFLKTGSIILAGIGLLVYFSPLFALILSYYFPRNYRDIIKVLSVYLVMSAFVASGIYLSFMGYTWQTLSSVGEGLFIFPTSGGYLKLISGFMRSPEIAAWHAGAGLCVTAILFMSLRKDSGFKWVSPLLVLYFFMAIVFTGRRKFIIEIILFLFCYAFLLFYFKKGTTKIASLILVAGIFAAAVGTFYVFPSGERERFQRFTERSVSVRESAAERLYNNTIGSFLGIIEQNGFIGAGAGTASQGAQHFGGGDVIVGGNAEGGLGKILAEMGIPGLALLLWVMLSIGRGIWRLARQTAKMDATSARLFYGFIAFLIANAILFLVAHQAFGDIFVLLILGYFVGFIIAYPRIERLKSYAVRKGSAGSPAIMTWKSYPGRVKLRNH